MSWPIGATNHERALHSIETAQLDALVAVTPENAWQLSGVHNFIASRWRVPGLAAAAVAANGNRSVVTGDNGANVPDDIMQVTCALWIDSVDLAGVEGETVFDRISAVRGDATIDRPAQFWIENLADAVAETVRAVSPSGKRIGIERSQLAEPFFARLRQRLPDVEWVDATTLFEDLRSIKEPWELDLLRDAGRLTEAGIAGAIASIQPGMDGADISIAYQRAVLDAVLNHPNKRWFNDAEGLVWVGVGGPSSLVEPGVTIKFDQQVDLGGYHSDVGRTVAIKPTRHQREIHTALHTGLIEALAAIQIGDPLAAIYEAGAGAIRAAGLRSYSRGHLGHGVGLTTSFEEAPFITANELRPIVPGMALSIEMPLYLGGVGSFQLETMVLVHGDQIERVDRLPFEIDLDQSLIGYFK